MRLKTSSPERFSVPVTAPASAVLRSFIGREELEAAKPLHVAKGFDEVAAWLLRRIPR